MTIGRSTRTRQVALLEEDACGVLTVILVTAVLAVGRCRRCRRRYRILPVDVLPRKRFSLPVIEWMASRYASGAMSLRDVAWGTPGEVTPSHTTVHAWTEGFGAHGLGRPIGDAPGATPFAALLAETASRHQEVFKTWPPEVFVDERRYRSAPRREVSVRRTPSVSEPMSPAPWAFRGARDAEVDAETMDEAVGSPDPAGRRRA